MAVRGVHSFDNDDAVQWAQAYCDMGFDVAASTIRIALEDFSNNRLTASIASRGIAAVEAVAFALGRGGPEAQRLYKTAPAADPAAAEALIEESVEFLNGVVGASELATFWKDAGPDQHSAWVGSIKALQSRVRGQAPEPVAAASGGTQPKGAPAQSPDEVTLAIRALSDEVRVLREEMHENFARLAKWMDGGSK